MAVEDDGYEGLGALARRAVYRQFAVEPFGAFRDALEPEMALFDYRQLIGVNLITEGYGAVGHPSAKTHQRMGKELAERIRAICGELL